MIIRGQSRKLDVPESVAGKPGQWVEVRLLSGTQMDRARMVQSERQVAAAKVMGSDFIRQVQETRARLAASQPPQEGDAIATSDYDADELVNAAFKDSSEGGLVVGEKASELLDSATRDWLAKEVEAMNVRPLRKSPGSAG